jgi:hypothetical protein
MNTQKYCTINQDSSNNDELGMTRDSTNKGIGTRVPVNPLYQDEIESTYWNNYY